MAVSLTHTTVAVGTNAGNGEIAKEEWNEEHTLTMGTGKLLGRSTSGTGAAEEISVGTGLSLSAGTLSATATGGASLGESVPSTPASGTELFAQVRAGRRMSAQKDTAGIIYPFQPFYGSNKFAFVCPTGNSNGFSTVGFPSLGTAGTGTTRTVAGTATSLLSGSRRVCYVPASAATNEATGLVGNAHFFRSTTSGVGGFFFSARWGFNSWASGNRCFIGIGNGSIAGSADPTNALLIAGVGADAGDANFSFFTNDSASTATKTSTGIAIASDKLYELRLYSPPNATSLYMYFERIDDGTTSTLEATSNLPDTDFAIALNVRASTGSTTSGAQIDIVTVYAEIP
jgi:hypothetical protein